MSLEIRTATVLDAKMVCAAVRRSKTECCQADHRGDTKNHCHIPGPNDRSRQTRPRRLTRRSRGSLPLRSEVGRGQATIHRDVDTTHPARRVAAQPGNDRGHFIRERRARHALGVGLQTVCAQHGDEIAEDGGEHRAGGHAVHAHPGFPGTTLVTAPCSTQSGLP